jgi:hypothetical protein
MPTACLSPELATSTSLSVAVLSLLLKIICDATSFSSGLPAGKGSKEAAYSEALAG